MTRGEVDPRAPEEAVEVKAGRIVLLVVGVLLVVLGFGVGLAGGGATWAHLAGRDADGYVSTPAFELVTDSAAISAEHLDLVTEPGDWAGWVRRVDLRLTVEPADADAAVFVGLAPRAAVEAYLAGVAHDEVASLDVRGSGYERTDGDRPLVAPWVHGFWTVSATGEGTQVLDWPAEAGSWAVVIANADGSSGVAVEATAGVRTEALLPIGLGLLVVALLLIAGGSVLIVLALPHDEDARRGADRTPEAPPSVVPATGRPAPTAYPLAVTGELDPDTSRWQWLVKWLLLVPHLVVLAVLWTVFVVLTAFAGVAILVTGRYPRGIFDLNVGILRWTWRVTFYGYGVLGTDRYPPFSLEDADHPAHLEVAYPERLSRGLVLVKWWLLVLPHLLIVSLLTGGGAAWVSDTATEVRWPLLGGGLIGVLVLVAAVSLLVTSRYPRGLFDLVVGLNRWVLRVVVYAALMTDRYPPFRLDSGGQEPPVPVPPPPPVGPEATSPKIPEGVPS
jgi:hypothetical protein